jgi:precorrin-3B methylase
VGIVKNASREGEEHFVCRCEDLKRHLGFVDMSTILIVGNSKTKFDRNGIMMTPRGYKK